MNAPRASHPIVSLGDTAGVGIGLLAVGAVCVLVAAGCILAGALTGAAPAYVVGAVFGLIGIGFGLGSRGPLQVAARFEPGVLHADQPAWGLGAQARGRFRRTVKQGSTDVRSITGSLVLEEWVRWREGTDTRTATREIHRYPVAVEPRQDPLAVVADLVWELPAYPPSFRAPDNEVRWRLIVDVVMADGFEEDSIIPLWVHPWTDPTVGPADRSVDRR